MSEFLDVGAANPSNVYGNSQSGESIGRAKSQDPPGHIKMFNFDKYDPLTEAMPTFLRVSDDDKENIEFVRGLEKKNGNIHWEHAMGGKRYLNDSTTQEWYLCHYNGAGYDNPEANQYYEVRGEIYKYGTAEYDYIDAIVKNLKVQEKN